jgi:peptidyl-prolyl cis-trans isomerase SurA
VKEAFEELVKAQSAQDRWREMQEEVVRSNPGKSREELMSILRERRRELGLAMQKQAVESARAAVVLKLRRKAEAELIDERLKLRAAKELGTEISDEEVKTLLRDVAARKKMTYEDFARYLQGRGVDIATVGERLRARKAWLEAYMKRYGDSSAK